MTETFPGNQNLEALLESQDPGVRRNALERCLQSEDSRLRALGAQSLAGHDSPEAFFQVDRMLLGTNLPDKHFALQICILLPFERTKDLLMSFFQQEEDPALLQSAGVILAVNPDPDISSRLFEIGRSSPPLKRQMLQIVIRQIFQSMHEAHLNKSLVHDLGSPDPVYRLFAIQQISDLPSGPELRSAIEGRLRLEKEPQCLEKLKECIKRLERGPTASIREMISGVPAPELPGLIPKALSGSVSERLATLGVFLSRAPQLLEPHLPALLNDPEPVIRGMGVRALTILDPDESIAYLEDLLLGQMGASKKAALQECLFLPFRMVKSTLLKFCGAETDPENLDTAGVIFLSNPDWDVPFRLFELLPDSTPEKMALLGKIINGVSESLLSSPQAATEARTPSTNQVLENFLHGLDQWQEKRVSERENRQEKLLDAVVREFGADEVEALLGVPVGQDPASPVPPLPPSVAELGNLAEDAQIKGLSIWPESETGALEPFLKKLIGSAGGTARLQAMAIRTAARLRIGSFLESARALVGRGEERLRIASLEYIVRFDPKSGQRLAETFAHSPQPWMRAKGIEMLQSQNLSLSVDHLAFLLRSGDRKARNGGFLTLLRFPFHTIRDILTEFLASPRGDSCLKAGTLLFEAHPDPENLFCLFRIERSLEKRGAVGNAEAIREARIRLEGFLRGTGRLAEKTSGDLESDWENRVHALENARDAPPKPYTFSRKLDSETTSEDENPFDKLARFVSSAPIFGKPHPLAIFSAGLLLFLLAAFAWNFAGNKPPQERTGLSGPSCQAVSTGRPEEISNDLEKVLNEQSKKAFFNKSLNKGRLAIATGDAGKAETEYDAALREDPGNPYVRVLACGGLCEAARLRKDAVSLEKRIGDYSSSFSGLPPQAAQPFRAHLEELRQALTSLSRGGK